MRKAKAGNNSRRYGNGIFSDIFGSKVTYRPKATKSALSAAYTAGKHHGDTGEFDLWWKNYPSKVGVSKESARKEFARGVEGEPSSKQEMREQVREEKKKAIGIRGRYRGCNIYFDPESQEYFSSCDKDSKFDSYKEAKANVDWFKDKSKNPCTDCDRSPKEITEGFHGRESVDETEILEEEQYEEELAGLGMLVELEIQDSEGSDKVVPIKFNYSNPNDAVLLACDSEGNIEFVGGDQDLELEKLGIDTDRHQKVKIGYVYTISYFADKHHLEGPKYQAKGTEYIHQFGEEGGEMPCLVYDTRNRKLELVGGSYEITDEGIRN